MEAVLSFIKFCMGNVTVDKCIRMFPNQKPWKNGQVKILLQNCNTDFMTGNRELYSSARSDLKQNTNRLKSTTLQYPHPIVCNNTILDPSSFQLPTIDRAAMRSGMDFKQG